MISEACSRIASFLDVTPLFLCDRWRPTNNPTQVPTYEFQPTLPIVWNDQVRRLIEYVQRPDRVGPAKLIPGVYLAPEFRTLLVQHGACPVEAYEMRYSDIGATALAKGTWGPWSAWTDRHVVYFTREQDVRRYEGWLLKHGNNPPPAPAPIVPSLP